MEPRAFVFMKLADWLTDALHVHPSPVQHTHGKLSVTLLEADSGANVAAEMLSGESRLSHCVRGRCASG